MKVTEQQRSLIQGHLVAAAIAMNSINAILGDDDGMAQCCDDAATSLDKIALELKLELFFRDWYQMMG